MLPRIGVGVPNGGRHASPEAIVAVARAAEELGFDSVWTFERLMHPLAADGGHVYGFLPEPNGSLYDPLETLTWVAAHTRRVRLGTCVLDALLHPPVVLARRLATLDRLSGGRLVVGLGQGWMPEEFAAAGVPMSRRGRGFEEHLAAVRACWATDPVEHRGRRYPIARSQVGPKPAQPQLPVLIGAVARPAVERAARLGAGFTAVFQDWDTATAHLDRYRRAGGAGPVVLRVNPERIDAPRPAAPFTGEAASVVADLARARTAGIDEVIWDLTVFGLEPSRQVDALAALRAACRERSAA